MAEQPVRPLTPREIVAELDKYIIGQAQAKRSVAIALRNRWRRQQLPPELRDEVAPKNIIMIGPTGVGKTEIARRLARLARSPFLKVEATKFTEVGYVGRDVESMIRDLTHIAVDMVKGEERRKVEEKARQQAEEQLLDLLLPGGALSGDSEAHGATRERFRQMLRDGKLEERLVELEVVPRPPAPMVEIFAATGMEELQTNLQEMFANLMPNQGRKKRRKVTVAEARKLLEQEAAGRLIDMDKVVEKAIARVEQTGIIFLDEIDKVAARGGSGPDVSREGVQRDLLPIVEGTSVHTKYGVVRTDHILFIASGAFHVAKPSDLLPELQGRFPIRVELDPLTQKDFARILTEPENALVTQYRALMETENIELVFQEEAVEEIARIAYEVNERMENIGARRLHTVMEKLLEEVSYNAPDIAPQRIVITAQYVRERLADIVEDQDLSKFIL